MLSDEEIIRSFDTEVPSVVTNWLERIGFDDLQKFSELSDDAVKRDFIDAYKALREFVANMPDIPVRISSKLDDDEGAKCYLDLDGKCYIIILDKTVFGLNKQVALTKTCYGYDVETNNPIGATLIHEFGHVLWTNSRSEKQQKATPFIERLYYLWRTEYDTGKLPEYGTYARTNIIEWWAETIAKAIAGVPDKYTGGVMKIIKTYLL